MNLVRPPWMGWVCIEKHEGPHRTAHIEQFPPVHGGVK
jgi:hypothetical protein